MVFFDLIFYRSETNIVYLIVCWLPSPSSSLVFLTHPPSSSPSLPPSADLQTSRRVIWMRKLLNGLMAWGVKAECCWVRVDANTHICCLVNQCGAFGCGESPIRRLEKMSSRFQPLYLLSASSHFLFNPSHPSFTSPPLLPSVIPSSISNHPPPRRSAEVSVSRRKATFLLFISLFASHPVLFVFHCSCQNCQPALPLSSPCLSPSIYLFSLRLLSITSCQLREGTPRGARRVDTEAGKTPSEGLWQRHRDEGVEIRRGRRVGGRTGSQRYLGGRWRE